MFFAAKKYAENNNVDLVYGAKSKNDLNLTEELEALRSAAEGDTNLLIPMRAALKAGATVGEVSAELRAVFGSYKP